MDSYSPYLGPARLGTPYRPDPTYIEYFAQFADANNLEDCKIYPEMLSIASSKLEIIIENVRGVHSFFICNLSFFLSRSLDCIPCLRLYLPQVQMVAGQGTLSLLKGRLSHRNRPIWQYDISLVCNYINTCDT